MKTFAVTVTRGAKHPEFRQTFTVRASDKRDACFHAIRRARLDVPANVALFATAVEVQQSLRKQVIDALSDELRAPRYRGSTDLSGYCYVASEAYFHLTGGYDRWTPKQMVHEDESHWFLVDRTTGGIADLTMSQFTTYPDYTLARGRGFQTKQPSKRAQVVIDRVKANR